MRLNVVVVDDSAINLKLFKALLDKIPELDVTCFESSSEGLVWCALNPVDFVILDYMMPAPDGLAFLERLRAMPGRHDIPVLMTTANDHREIRYEALAGGASDFLNKPIDKSEFIARASNLCELRRSQRRMSDHAAWLAEAVDKATAEVREREREIIVRLVRAAEFRDPETGSHIQRMAAYSRLIAERLGLPLAEQEIILAAAPMHDVGKLGTPDHILLKPGKLTPEEFEIMKEHARKGYEILADSNSRMLQVAAIIALSHHEKFDGSGYPGGLRGEDIPLYGRIVAVADVFDALTSARPYKPAWTLERAVEFLQENRDKHFDPACLDAFLGAWDEVLAIRERYADDPADMGGV